MRMTCNDQLAATIRALMPAGLCAATAALALPGTALAAESAAIAAVPAGPLAAIAARPGQRAYSLPVIPAPRFGPSASALEDGAQLLHRLAAAPARPLKAAVPQFRVDADDGALTSTWHQAGYDLRLEYGTAFYRTAAVPGQQGPLITMRTRLMSRVVTRF